MFDTLRRDIQAAKERDPACRGTLEVLLCYPGIHALWFHRLAHRCWRAGFLLLGRFISHLGRFFTGIEIHPAARIGPGVFIDHGMGVVIGETAEVGENVTIYQGVTLGGTSLERVKRHPTIQRNVVIGSGAKVLGPFTVGENSRIGSGSVVVKEVPPNSVVVGVPGRVIYRDGRKVTTPIDLNMVDLPDPVAQTIQGVVERLEELEQEVASLRVALEAAQRQPAASAPGERS
ncbi:MAG: serine O-acetyltransferase [Candidatus Methylomirabilales bacterium]